MHRLARIRRALALLPFAVAALALSSCGSSQPFQLTEVDHASQVAQNGPHADVTLHWTGNPVFPVSVGASTGPLCDATCINATTTFDKPANPLVWSQATYCTGNTDSSAPPAPFDGYIWLTDAGGHQTQHVYIKSLCYYTSVPIKLESIVLIPQGPSVPATLRALNQLPWSALDLVRSAALAAGMLLVVAFPAQLFNSTLQAHYDEVMGWFTRFRRAATRVAQPARSAPRWAIAAVLLGSSLLSGLLDPNLGFNVASVETVLGALAAISLTTFLYSWVHAQHARRLTGERGAFHIYRGGIAIAVLCVLLSRITTAQPGYMYGVMVGFAVAGTGALPRHHRGRMTAVAFGVILATSLAMWLLWTPVRSAAEAHTVFPLVVLSSAMASVFLGGMTSLVFSLMPLRFLDGEHLWAWRRGVWLALFGTGMFLFVHVVLNASSAALSPQRSYAVAIGMFTGFGLLSTCFWAYFRFRPTPRATQPHHLAAPGGG